MTYSPAFIAAVSAMEERRRVARYHASVDVEEMLSWGVSCSDIARRTGGTRASIARRMRRAGRPDLARPFDREIKRERTARAKHNKETA